MLVILRNSDSICEWCTVADNYTNNNDDVLFVFDGDSGGLSSKDFIVCFVEQSCVSPAEVSYSF